MSNLQLITMELFSEDDVFFCQKKTKILVIFPLQDDNRLPGLHKHKKS